MLFLTFGFTQLDVSHLLLLEYLVFHFSLLSQFHLFLLSHPLKQLLFICPFLLALFLSNHSLLPELFIEYLAQVLLLFEVPLLLSLLFLFELLLLEHDDLVPLILREVTWQRLLVCGQLRRTLVTQL
jgi:hypothetical protein